MRQADRPTGSPVDAPADETGRGGLALLRDRRFGPYFFGSLASNTGTWFQNVAAIAGAPPPDKFTCRRGRPPERKPILIARNFRSSTAKKASRARSSKDAWMCIRTALVF